MNRIKNYIFIAVALCMTACGESSSKSIEPTFEEVTFEAFDPEYYDVAIRYQHITNCEENPIFASIEFQNYSNTFGSHATMPMELDSAMKAMANEYISGGIEGAEYDDAHSYLLEQHTFLTRKKSILCYETNIETYTGGAHGGYSLWYECFDLATGRLYDFDYLYDGEWAEAIRELIYEKLIAVEPDVDIYVGGTEHLPMHSSTLITESGIILVYQPYDVAPPSQGIVTVELSDMELAATGAPILWAE